jgi:hypothetical protein
MSEARSGFLSQEIVESVSFETQGIKIEAIVAGIAFYQRGHCVTTPICWRKVRLSSRCQLSVMRPCRTRRMSVAMKSTGWPFPRAP